MTSTTRRPSPVTARPPRPPRGIARAGLAVIVMAVLLTAPPFLLAHFVGNPVAGKEPPAELLPLGRPTGSRDELAVVDEGPVSVVPEPTTLAVFGVGLLLLFRRRSSV